MERGRDESYASQTRRLDGGEEVPKKASGDAINPLLPKEPPSRGSFDGQTWSLS